MRKISKNEGGRLLLGALRRIIGLDLAKPSIQLYKIQFIK